MRVCVVFKCIEGEKEQQWCSRMCLMNRCRLVESFGVIESEKIGMEAPATTIISNDSRCNTTPCEVFPSSMP